MGWKLLDTVMILRAVRMEKSHGRQMECMNYMDLSILNPG